MLTIVLLLSLLITFISVVMTVGNALSRTILAKFWAFTATVAIFISMFIFIIDLFNLLEIDKHTANPSEILGIVGGDDNSLDDPFNIIQDTENNLQNNNQTNNNQINHNNQTGNNVPNNNMSINDTKVARIMLLDLFAKRFSDNITGINVQQKDWLMKNAHLYPANTDEKLIVVRSNAIANIKQDQIMQSIDAYKQKIISGYGVIIEKMVDENTNIREMQLLILSDDGGMYVAYYPNTCDVKLGEEVVFYGTPITSNMINSDMFGPVNTVLLYASYISSRHDI